MNNYIYEDPHLIIKSQMQVQTGLDCNSFICVVDNMDNINTLSVAEVM